MAFAHAYTRKSHACATIVLTCCTCEPASQQTQAIICVFSCYLSPRDLICIDIGNPSNGTQFDALASQTSDTADRSSTRHCIRRNASIYDRGRCKKHKPACSARGSRRGDLRRRSPVCPQHRLLSRTQLVAGASAVCTSVLERVSSDARWWFAATASASSTHPLRCASHALSRSP